MIVNDTSGHCAAIFTVRFYGKGGEGKGGGGKQNGTNPIRGAFDP